MQYAARFSAKQTMTETQTGMSELSSRDLAAFSTYRPMIALTAMSGAKTAIRCG
jgi:hypothetical protein